MRLKRVGPFTWRGTGNIVGQRIEIRQVYLFRSRHKGDNEKVRLRGFLKPFCYIKLQY